MISRQQSRIDNQFTGLLDTAYSPNQMSYDLRRLRLRGLIERIPNTNTYTITPDGISSMSRPLIVSRRVTASISDLRARADLHL